MNPQKQLPPKAGFTLVELLVLIAIVGILIGMMLPAVRRSCSAARRSECSSRIRQITIAMHNYQDAHKCLPPTMGTFAQNGGLVNSAGGQTSALVGLMPFLEHQATLDQITTAGKYNGVDYPAMTVSPTDENYTPWQTRIYSFECPEDRGNQSGFGRTNYAFSIGDAARDLYEINPPRGALSTRQKTTLESIADGTSNTIMMVEVCGSPANPLSKIAAYSNDDFLNDPSLLDQLYDEAGTGFKSSVNFAKGHRGRSWADGMAASTLANTILPPNGINCAVEASRSSDGIFSAGSNHNSGANVTFADGSTHFISDTVDVGDPSATTLTAEQLKQPNGIPSPHGVWGSQGSANGNEYHAEWSN